MEIFIYLKKSSLVWEAIDFSIKYIFSTVGTIILMFIVLMRMFLISVNLPDISCQHWEREMGLDTTDIDGSIWQNLKVAEKAGLTSAPTGIYTWSATAIESSLIDFE